MGTNKKSSKESKLKRILKAPLRVLASARDFYMKGIAEYSDQVCVMTNPTGNFNFNTMPRSCSVSSTKSNHFDDDYRELLRAASTRSPLGRRSNNQINMDLSTRSATKVADNMPRSHSVGIGTIDEETPCDFDEEDDVNVKTDHVYPRSKSYAVSNRTPTRAF